MEHRSPRVLLLERNVGLRALLVEALAELGFDVAAGGSRQEALELLLAGPAPDLLVIDLVDEGSGGRALLAFLGEQPETARIPAIVMTDAEPRGRTGRCTPLLKPFGFEELRAAATQALAGSGAPAAPRSLSTAGSGPG